jgi:hypothetical protein
MSLPGRVGSVNGAKTMTTLSRQATLIEVLTTLATVGVDAFMALEGLAEHAEILAFGQMTARRASYDAALWDCWSALLAVRGDDLRAMAAGQLVDVMAKNEAKMAVLGLPAIPAEY